MRQPQFWFMRRLAAGALRRAKEAHALAAISAAAARNWIRPGRGHKVILLHAGEHKTGTTSIQSMLVSERGTFARQGIHVLRAGQGQDGAHHSLIYTIQGQRHSRWMSILLRGELEQATLRTVLISSEASKEAIVGGDGNRLIDALRAAGAARVRLLLYVRSPFELANSAYSTKTSQLNLEGATFADFVKAQDAGPAYHYERFLELAMRDDVDLLVRPYGAAARSSIGRDFGEALSIELSCTNEPRLNTSLGPVGLEAMRIMTTEMMPFSTARRRHLFAALRPVARSLNEQPFWGLDERTEAALGTADQRTEQFALAVWGRGWREVIGTRRRALNVFDPADEQQRILLERALTQMREVAAELAICASAQKQRVQRAPELRSWFDRSAGGRSKAGSGVHAGARQDR